MNGGASSANANALQGDFGEAWLGAVAAGCGLLHGPPATLDLQKADVQLTMPGEVGGVLDPTVQVQVKTTLDLPINDDGTASFELDVKTYDELRKGNRTIRRVLVVIGLERDGDRIRLREDGTLLVGRSAWISLEAAPETDNLTTTTLRVPLANTVDKPGLRTLLEIYGIPRSSPVPDVDPWSGP